MRSMRRAAVPTALLALLVSAGVTRAQAPAADAPPRKSVYGKLESIDAARNGVVMRTDAGEKLAWKCDKAVVDEVAKYKPGDAMIVIYKQMSANEKRVTAVAFPGAAAKPTYVNMTGARIKLRSAAMVDGVCGPVGPDPASEFTIPDRGLGEAVEACWCCAIDGETCSTSTKSGNGKAFLVQCFK